MAQIARWDRAVGTRIIAVIGLALMLGQSVSYGSSAHAETFSASPELIAAEREAVESAYEMFETAGLTLPDVIIAFHADSAGCRGNSGAYEKLAYRTATVDVCYARQDMEAGHINRSRLLWHELAHAYVEPRVDPDTKQALLDLLDLQRWNSGEWSERGADFAVEILIWGIKDGRYRLHNDLRELDCEVKAVGYTLLTGFSAPTC